MRRDVYDPVVLSALSRDCAIKCTITSVSLLVWKMEPCVPCACESLRIHQVAVVRQGDRALVDCTMMGWAFSSDESPAVE